MLLRLRNMPLIAPIALVGCGGGDPRPMRLQLSRPLTGTARSGPLAGRHLTPIVHGDEFWFVWAAFLPTTAIRQ